MDWYEEEQLEINMIYRRFEADALKFSRYPHSKYRPIPTPTSKYWDEINKKQMAVAVNSNEMN